MDDDTCGVQSLLDSIATVGEHEKLREVAQRKFFLEDQLGRPVDLVLADSLKPRLKPIITREVAYA